MTTDVYIAAVLNMVSVYINRRSGRGDEMNQNKETIWQIIWPVIGFGLVMIYTLIDVPFSLYHAFCVFFAGWVFRKERQVRLFTADSGRECTELMEFLAELRHWYYVYSDVEEAVAAAIDSFQNSSMERKLKKFLRAVSEEDDTPYMSENRILYLIYVNCKITREYGDSLENGKSVFIKNLGLLREELQVQKKHITIRRHAYLGIIPIAVIPIFTLPLIRQWCCENLPELELLYEGNYGILTTFGLCMFTCLVYEILCFFRYPEGLAAARHPFADRLLGCEWVLGKLGNYTEKHWKEVKQLKHRLAAAGDLFETDTYLLLQFLYGLTALGLTILLAMITKGSAWLWLTIGLVAASIGIRIPKILLWLQELLYKKYREQEAAQFQGIASMMMGMSRISIYELLEAMEETAMCYKALLRRCLLELPYDEVEALQNAAVSAQGCKGMVRLLENLRMCDMLGTTLALEEAAKERKFYMEMYGEEEKQKLEDRAAVAQLIAFIPFSAIVMFYLIIPFVFESLRELGEISSEFYT